MVVVARDDLQHGGENGRAHDGGVFPEGVEDAQAVAARIVLRHTDLVVVAGADEGIGNDLVKPEGTAGLTQLPLAELNRAEAAAAGQTARKARGQLVVAVEAGDLLREIGVVLHVAAPGGNQHRVPVKAETEVSENLAHRALVNVGAEQAVDPGRFQLHGSLRLLSGIDVDDALHDLAAAEQLYELTGALYGGQGVLRVKPLFVAGRGVGAHPERGGGAADGGAVEVGRLKEHHRRVAHDFTVLAAHDAADGHGLLAVADAEHGGRDGARVPVQGADRLALAGAADVNLPALDTAEIKGVHRLAVLEHDVVGDIDNVVDRADAGIAQPLLHPGRGGGDLHVFDHAGGVARAELRRLDDHLSQRVDIAAGLR